MDTAGAVDLSVQATRLDLPPPPTARQRSQLERAAFSAGWNGPAESWASTQVVRLAVASVLEARLLNTRSSRLSSFQLVANPQQVTLRQLSHLVRPHAGTAGQAFELAVSDAVEAQDHYVCDAIRDGLHKLGLPWNEPLGMVTLGLEKIRPEHREQFWSGVRHQLPPDGVLRTGGVGRPKSIATALAQLQEANWASMRTVPGQPPPSQLARCDALVTCGNAIVPTSFKINCTAVRPWRDVPLHITGYGRPALGPVVLNNSSQYGPAVIVRFGRSNWFRAFETSLRVVDEVLDRLDGRALIVSDTKSKVLVDGLVRSRDLTIAEVCEILRKMPPQMDEQAANVKAVRTGDTFPVADYKDLLEEWREDGQMGRIVIGQPHIFGLVA